MDTVNLNTGEFIINKNGHSEIELFLKEGVANFLDELSQYINDNADPGIVSYATEMTMASLFVSGNLKRNPLLTAVQEYYINLEDKEKQKKGGRPDIFMKSGGNAIWIECKYEGEIKTLRSGHWDMEQYVERDYRDVFPQLYKYYNSEKNVLNNSYNRRFLVSLSLKLIRENKAEHLSKVDNNLKTKVNTAYDRGWFYQVGFFPSTDDNQIGLEVYGTFKEVFKETSLIA